MVRICACANKSFTLFDNILMSGISGSHSGGYEDLYLQGYNAM
jgi:hypothetical protein